MPRDWTRDEALLFWFAGGHEVFVAEENGELVGCYYIQPNQRGGGSHVANCGYATATGLAGRGIATAMCEHSMRLACHRGYRAMQFNFVVSTNERAVRLWKRLGFEVVGRIPDGFNHPDLGLVDAFVMHRQLT